MGDKVLCIFEQAPLEISSHPAPLHVWQRQEKSTRLLATYPQVSKLAVKCNGQHEHAKWGRVRNKWATAEEVEYPTGLCQAWSNVMVQILCEHGAVKSALQLSDIGEFTTRQSRAEVGKQPRGNRIPPFVREYKQLIKLTGPLSALPTSKSLTALGIYLILSVLNPTLLLFLSIPKSSALIFEGTQARVLRCVLVCIGNPWSSLIKRMEYSS